MFVQKSSKAKEPIHHRAAQLRREALSVPVHGNAAPDPMAARLNGSPRMLAQRKQIKQLFRQPAQLAEEASSKPNRSGLPDNLRQGVESLSGMPMDDVKVHYNSPEPAHLQAHAFAQGRDIHVAPGQEQHLPHEAWHVVQQKEGRVKPTMQMHSGAAVNDDQGLEHEADAMGAKAIQVGQEPHQGKQGSGQSVSVMAGGATTQGVMQAKLTPGSGQLKGLKNWKAIFHFEKSSFDKIAELVADYESQKVPENGIIQGQETYGYSKYLLEQIQTEISNWQSSKKRSGGQGDDAADKDHDKHEALQRLNESVAAELGKIKPKYQVDKEAKEAEQAKEAQAALELAKAQKLAKKAADAAAAEERVKQAAIKAAEEKARRAEGEEIYQAPAAAKAEHAKGQASKQAGVDKVAASHTAKMGDKGGAFSQEVLAKFNVERGFIIQQRYGFWQNQWESLDPKPSEGADSWVMKELENDAETAKLLDELTNYYVDKINVAKKEKEYDAKFIKWGKSKNDYVKQELNLDTSRMVELDDDLSLKHAVMASTQFLSTLDAKIQTIASVTEKSKGPELKKAILASQSILQLQNVEWTKLARASQLDSESMTLNDRHNWKALSRDSRVIMDKLSVINEKTINVKGETNDGSAFNGTLKFGIGFPHNRNVARQFLPRGITLADQKENEAREQQMIQNGIEFEQWLMETSRKMPAEEDESRKAPGAMDKIEIASMFHSAVTGFLK